MHKRAFIAVVLLAAAMASAQGPVDFSRVLDSATPQRGLYPVNKNAQQQIAELLLRAKSERKRLLLVFGADWCYDCHVLEKAFHSRELNNLVQKNFLVLHIDIGRGEANRDLQRKYDIDVEKGVPAIAVLDNRGRLISSPPNDKVSAARRMTYAELADSLNQWKANPPVAANQ
jgi:thiol:disulfide interchange protein